MSEEPDPKAGAWRAATCEDPADGRRSFVVMRVVDDDQGCRGWWDLDGEGQPVEFPTIEDARERAKVLNRNLN